MSFHFSLNASSSFEGHLSGRCVGGKDTGLLHLCASQVLRDVAAFSALAEEQLWFVFVLLMMVSEVLGSRLLGGASSPCETAEMRRLQAGTRISQDGGEGRRTVQAVWRLSSRKNTAQGEVWRSLKVTDGSNQC